jgi:hypothetical protein
MALKIITSPSGARFTVSADHADRFQAFVNDLEAGGYAINRGQSGGYNKRNIRGTRTPSQHSFGRAIDVNWTDNARGKPGKIPQELALRLAKKHGLTWGGTWKNRDDMHFEVDRKGAPVPMAQRSLVAAAGLATPPMAVGGPPPAPPPNVAMNAGSAGVRPTGTAGYSGPIHTKRPNLPPNPAQTPPPELYPAGHDAHTAQTHWAKGMHQQMLTNTPALPGSLDAPAPTDKNSPQYKNILMDLLGGLF